MLAKPAVCVSLFSFKFNPFASNRHCLLQPESSTFMQVLLSECFRLSSEPFLPIPSGFIDRRLCLPSPGFVHLYPADCSLPTKVQHQTQSKAPFLMSFFLNTIISKSILLSNCSREKLPNSSRSPVLIAPQFVFFYRKFSFRISWFFFQN